MFKNPILAKDFGVSSEHPLATLAGFEILSQGGNAIDATISASLTLAVTLPHLGSLGGDFFALIYINEEDKIYCINASGWVSEKISVDEILKRGYKNIIPESALSIVVPGMVDGLYKIHKKFGSKEFKDLVNFPLKLAEEGYDIEGLKKKGHNVKVLKYPSRTGVAHALSSSSIITLAYDIRGDSLALGY